MPSRGQTPPRSKTDAFNDAVQTQKMIAIEVRDLEMLGRKLDTVINSTREMQQPNYLLLEVRQHIKAWLEDANQ